MILYGVLDEKTIRWSMKNRTSPRVDMVMEFSAWEPWYAFTEIMRLLFLEKEKIKLFIRTLPAWVLEIVQPMVAIRLGLLCRPPMGVLNPRIWIGFKGLGQVISFQWVMHAAANFSLFLFLLIRARAEFSTAEFFFSFFVIKDIVFRTFYAFANLMRDSKFGCLRGRKFFFFF